MQNVLEPYRNILVMKPGAVGDLLQMTPVIRALKQYSPGAVITILVGSEATASLFRNNPRVSQTIVFDRSGLHRSISAQCELWLMLHSRRYDLVLNFQRSNLKAWFLASAAFPCRVLVYHKAKDRTVHAVVNYLETLAPGLCTRTFFLPRSGGSSRRRAEPWCDPCGEPLACSPLRGAGGYDRPAARRQSGYCRRT
ncbi:MAG: glycosyl transferase, family 9 [Nitrospirae bacterium]|nr:glycosyl transferase, family 9 [Nitrospirota bacterium]